MPTSTSEERLRWIQPIVDGRVSITTMSLVCPFSIRTLKYWLREYRTGGMAALNPRSRRPKSQPTETSIRIKERVLEKRAEEGLCALKLRWELADEGIYLHERTIGKILKAEGVTRKYRLRKPHPQKPSRDWLPGEMVEFDVKYVPVKVAGTQYYQYTAIDSATRWRYLKIYDSQTNETAIRFLHAIIQRFPGTIQAVKTDNHATFTNRYVGYPKSTDRETARLHPFDEECQGLGVTHYLIDPGKPQQNGRVEKSHGADQAKLYQRKQAHFDSLEELRYQTALWNMRYNDLKHISLSGQTPQEVLTAWVQNVRT